MKITSFNPFVIAKDAKETIAVFEALGFKMKHIKSDIKDIEENGLTSVRMKDPNGFHVDVVGTGQPRDMTAIRMNVDNFDEASKALTARGFKLIEGGNISVTSSSKAATLVSPTGFAIVLIEHLK